MAQWGANIWSSESLAKVKGFHRPKKGKRERETPLSKTWVSVTGVGCGHGTINGQLASHGQHQRVAPPRDYDVRKYARTQVTCELLMVSLRMSECEQILHSICAVSWPRSHHGL